MAKGTFLRDSKEACTGGYFSTRKQRLRGKGEVSQLGIPGVAAALVALLLAVAVAPGAALAQDDELVAGGAVVPDLTTQYNASSSYDIPSSATTIGVGETKTATISSENDYLYWFKFTPAKTGNYVFKASKPDSDSYYGDPYGALYKLNAAKNGLERLDSNDDGAGNLCFRVASFNMQAGATYYLACSEYDDENAQYLVSVTAFDPYDLSNWSLYVDDVYNDKPVTPANLGMEFEFDYDTSLAPKAPVYGTDYTVAGWYERVIEGDDDDYTWKSISAAPTKPGVYRVEVKGNGKSFKGTQVGSFYLYDAKDISAYSAYCKDELWANGSAVTLSRLNVVLHRHSNALATLKAGTHYVVKEWLLETYDSNIDDYVYTSLGLNAPKAPGYYRVKLVGKAPYKGERTLGFEIGNPTDLSNYSHDRNSAVGYDGKSLTIAKLKLAVYRIDEAGNRITLAYGTDYALDSWEGTVYASDGPVSKTGTNLAEIKEIGEYWLYFKGKGNYSGTKSIWVDIVDPKDLSHATISGYQEEYYGTGPAKLAPVVTSAAGVKLTAGTHYTLSIMRWSDADDDYIPVTSCTAQGDYRIKVTAKEGSGYAGNTHADFTVYPESRRVDISKWYFIDGVNASYAYTGKTIAPKLVVRSKESYGNVLEPENYTVTYTRKAAARTVTVTITGKGGYKGKLTCSFKITGGPKKGAAISFGGFKYKVTKGGAAAEVAFLGSKKAAKVKVPATIETGGIACKVTSIAAKAFNGNKKLKSLAIGANVKKIGAKAAKGCKKLKSVTVASGKLTKSAVKNLLKGSKIKTIKLSGKAAKAKKKAYQKYAGKKVKVK